MLKPLRDPLPAVSVEAQQELTNFLSLEAHLLDERRWSEWDALFAPGGMYWMPLTHDQDDPINHTSLFYEDAILRDVRMRRLEQIHAWSQQPVTRTSRLVSNVLVLAYSDQAASVRSAFHLVEWRKRRDLRPVAGHYTHDLVRIDGRWRIKLKRVDIISCDGVQDPFEVFV
jgi:ethylbenzene dioxygenase subunit beta